MFMCTNVSNKYLHFIIKHSEDLSITVYIYLILSYSYVIFPYKIPELVYQYFSCHFQSFVVMCNSAINM